MLYYSYLAPNLYKSQLLKFLKTHSQNKFSLCSHLQGFILPNGFRYLGFAFASYSYSLSFKLFKNPNNFLILSTSYFINILKFSKKIFLFPHQTLSYFLWFYFMIGQHLASNNSNSNKKGDVFHILSSPSSTLFSLPQFQLKYRL